MQLKKFRVTNYRNIKDSKEIDISDITAFVGQNEAGKSNLFEALYRINPFDGESSYNIDEDWPVDDWGNKDENAPVCEAHFKLSPEDAQNIVEACIEEGDNEETITPDQFDLSNVLLCAKRFYTGETTFSITSNDSNFSLLDDSKIQTWAKENLQKFVYIHDYEMSGSQIELDHLQRRRTQHSYDQLDSNEQSILTVLDLAKIDLSEFIQKGSTSEGRTNRTFEKRSASGYLTRQFQELWRQKYVKFEIDVDGNTLNILVEDVELGMPVKLNKRSTGFRWYVSFAWKFTHASKGEFKNCILLLEEPGIHLHYSAQLDLLEVLERLKETNTILYTTHLASMVDMGYPERIRIVEYINKKSTVKSGVVSSQKDAMAVIEMALGLVGNMSGLLGDRKVLIVEGGDDALILYKLAAVLRASGKESMSENIYLWPAKGASKVPMYAAFAIGQKWNSSVLLDSDEAGQKAAEKIRELYLKDLSEQEGKNFQILMLKKAAGIEKTDAAIEELFSDEYYIALVNEAYRVSIKVEDLPSDGSDMITKKVERVLKDNHHYSELDKGRVKNILLKKFDSWQGIKDLPKGTAAKAEKLFKAINLALEEIPKK